MDNYIFELILYYFEYEGTYKVEVYIEKPVRERMHLGNRKAVPH